MALEGLQHSKMKSCLIIIFIIIVNNLFAQVAPPCGNDYGSSSDESNISHQMRYGTINDAIDAINQAKNTRGLSLGCPQQEITSNPPNINEPLLSEIENIWNNIHAPAISAFNVTCPRIGRYENNSALGAYYAMQAGYYQDSAHLVEIADMMYDQQYASWNISAPDIRNKGVYGYISTGTSDPCYPGGVVGSSVSAVCSTLPIYCVNYSSGQFAGTDFLISSQDDANDWFDGGLAYDHGWVGVQMIEAAILQSDQSLKEKYRNSVELAGQYSIAEHSVKNHNYTAKMIWLLSELYAWTGDAIYKNELNLKLDKNLIPGILWDKNSDGFVDGTSPAISFSALAPIAQTPGRMWDGHNSVSWYQAMNTWAIMEAYIAFRDQGDTIRANELKPYATAMLDNLANEIITQGVISTNALGVRDITYALLIGIWKISQYENETHLNWNQAAWAMWNAGYFNTYNTNSVCVGLYLLTKSGTTYVPVNLRENNALSINNTASEYVKVNVFPNPVRNQLSVEINQNVKPRLDYTIIDKLGRTVLQGITESNKMNIEWSNLPQGLYIFSLLDKGERVFSTKLVKE